MQPEGVAAHDLRGPPLTGTATRTNGPLVTRGNGVLVRNAVARDDADRRIGPRLPAGDLFAYGRDATITRVRQGGR